MNNQNKLLKNKIFYFKNQKFSSILSIYKICFFQFDAEFRRWALKRNESINFDGFYATIEKLHNLNDIQFLIMYIDPRDNDLLPINNDDNFGRALKTAKPLLRIIIQRKGNDNYFKIILNF